MHENLGLHELGDTHGHDKVDDANRTVDVRVTEVRQVHHPRDLSNNFSKQNFEGKCNNPAPKSEIRRNSPLFIKKPRDSPT